MLLPLPEIIQKYNLDIKGVIQVGAHWAEEHGVYLDLGIHNIIYIEPCKDAFDILVNRFQNTEVYVYLIKAACADYEGQTEMYVSNNNQGQSNSILKPMLHLQQHKEVVFNETEIIDVVPLDKIMASSPMRLGEYNMLVMDVQGAEGLVLKGATETLKHIDIIYTEINTDYTYENNMLVGEMDELLNEFERVETYMPSPNWSWGDSAYIRRSLLHNN